MYGKISQIFLIFCLLTACAAPAPQTTPPLPSASPSSVQPTQTPELVATLSQPGYPYPPVLPTVNQETLAAYPAMKETQAEDAVFAALTETARPTNTPQPPTPTFTLTPPELTLPPLLPHVNLESLTLFDQKTGWAMQAYLSPAATGRFYNTDRKILRTTAGFASWRDVTPLTFREKTSLRTAYFYNSNTAVAIFYRNFLPDSADTELTGARTVNGGRTWQIGETMHFIGLLRSPAQIKMLDANRGWMMAVDLGAMGQSPLAFFATEDGGLHWKKVYDSNEQFQIDNAHTIFVGRNPIGNSGFALLDDQTAVFATGEVYRSNDGGKTWKQVLLPIPPAASDLEKQAGMGQYEPAAAPPEFWTKDNGVLVGRYFANLEIPPSIPKDLPTSEFLYFTQDGGESWTYSRSPARIGSPYFLDSQTGWYLGKSDPDPGVSTQMYQTTNGGKTWMQIQADSPLPLGSMIHFIDAQMGYAAMTFYTNDDLFDRRSVYGLPYFFYTVDGGRSWEKLELKLTP